MKKIVATLLALVLLMTAASALAAASQPVTITINKAYVKDMSADTAAAPAVIPSETLTFTIVAAQGVTNPDATIPTVTTVTADGKTTGFTIAFPAYTVPGLYTYTITETAGTSQGAAYNTNPMTLKVFVSYDETDRTKLNISYGVTIQNGTTGKGTELQNEYNVGNLTIDKAISGNLASSEAQFGITVTFTTESGKTVNSPITVVKGEETSELAGSWTSKEYHFFLKAGESIQFQNIPEGVSYTVVEDADHKLGEGETLDPNSAADKQYTVSGEVTTAAQIAADANATATITNQKQYVPDTGILLDSAPYMLILVLAMAGYAFMTLRRRKEER